MTQKTAAAATLLAAILANAKAAATTVVKTQETDITVSKGNLHEIPWNDTTLYRIGAVLDDPNLFVSTRLYQNKEGKFFLSAEWLVTPRNGNKFPGHTTNIWLGNPAKPEDGPTSLAAGLPLASDNPILAAFTNIVQALNNEETGAQALKELREAGIIYDREIPQPEGTYKATALAMPYKDLGSPEITLMGTAAGKGQPIKFLVTTRDDNGRMCWGTRPGYGLWRTESQDTKPHRIEGSPISQAAAKVWQKIFDKALEMSGKAETKFVAGTSTAAKRKTLDEMYYEKQTAEQGSEQGATEPSKQVMPSL